MKRLCLVLLVFITIGLFVPACQRNEDDGRLKIVATYSVLGSLVKELEGEEARVTVSVPNGMDPHEWEPSARDIEAIYRADIVVRNGLEFESGLGKVFSEAERRGVRFFTAADYVDVRYIDSDDDCDHDHDDHGHGHESGAPDPHLWTDPLAMKAVIAALADELYSSFGLDVIDQAENLCTRLDSLDNVIRIYLSTVPESNRKLVTGHESLGYFAHQYGFRLIGAIIPSLTSQAEVSAADIVALKRLITENEVSVIFTEMGTSPAVASAVSRETGARLVEINTHLLAEDGSYFTLMDELARAIGEALK